MTTIYVVTDGRYSDYRIVALYSDKEIADRLVKKHNENNRYGEAQVEEWILDEEPVPQERPPLWYVEFFHPDASNGNDICVIRRTEFYEDEDLKRRTDYYGCFCTYVDAEDEQHAAKIAMERHAIWRANLGLAELAATPEEPAPSTRLALD